MKRVAGLIVVVLFSVMLGGCYHTLKEQLQCPWLSLSDSVRAQGLGRYYDKKIDVDWLDKEIPRDSVEAYLTKAIPKHIYDSDLSIEQKKELAKKVLTKAINRWHTIKPVLIEGDIVAEYYKAWFQAGSTVGIVIIRGCTIIGDIHYPEIKAKTNEIIE